ncbi:MAG: DEAD/DEAH box helicase [Deltaproteobacteria bacterium]|nr:DEAD/DEAH box helicase [Deltaproteobacteria bacterium]
MPEDAEPSSPSASAAPADASSENLFAALPEDIQSGLRELGWRTPMPVQAATIPAMRARRDLIVQARTGSGKTGAFGIPIVAEVDADLRAPQALVLTPTRELANQVASELVTIGKHRGIVCLPIYGGVGYGPQLEGLAAGPHIVVGTPGRILDHLGQRRLVLDRVRFFVLDEADELLSLGFWPDMREIDRYLPPKERRQTCLFSATMPEKVRALTRVFMRDPEFVTLSEGQIAPAEIEHFFYLVSAQEKEQALVRILEYEDPESAIIFCNTKDDVRYVTAFLQRRGFDADQISGDLAQAARERAMARIKAGELRFLVATDVAARGIDISDLTCVIGYTAPDSPETYVHRTGRTGRAGKAGFAISLVSALDIGNFKYLQNVNRIQITERKLPSDAELLDRLRERLTVKVEQEMRAVPERERAWKIDRWVAVVSAMAASDEGRRELAAICSAYLKEHRPQTTVGEVEVGATRDADAERAPQRREGGGRSRRGGGRGRGGRGRR